MTKTFAIRVALFCALSTAAFCQSFTQVSGTVADPSGAVIANVSLELEDTATGAKRSTSTDASGSYSFLQVVPGSYKLTAKSQGFSTATVNGLRLLVNTPSTVNIKLEVGAVTESVSISAESVQVNTTDASLGNAVSTNAIVQLPFSNRNVVNLLALQPGVTFFTSNTDFRGRVTDSRSGSVNGGKSDQANVTLDGVDVNDQQDRFAFNTVLRVTPDSVQEFRTTTLNATADQGRTGGAQVALVTRSGSNELHGALYELHRNSATSANSFFNNSSGLKTSKLIRNQFGVAVGGPIKKNKAFFFLNYEGRRDASESAELRNVPSDNLKAGVVKFQRTDGTVGELSPNDIRTRIDPAGRGANQASLDVFKLYPTGNDFTVGDGLNIVGFRFNAPVKRRENTYIAKFDYQIDQVGNHRVYVRGNLQNDNQGGVPQFPGQQPRNVFLDNSKGYAIGYTAILRPTLISTTRYGFTRQGIETTGIQTASAVTFRTIDSIYGLTRGLSQIIPVNHLNQNFAWTKGSHDIRFGGDYRTVRNRRNNFDTSFLSATTNSSWLRGSGADLQTNVPGLDRRFRVAYNDAMMALLGIVSQVNSNYNYDVTGKVQPVGAPVRRNFANEEYEMFVQDTWRATKSLTITAGLRWSLMPPVYEANGNQTSAIPGLGDWFNLRGSLANQGKPQSDAGPIKYVAANSATGSGMYPFHKKNFAPRLSLAYSPQGDSGLSKFLFGGPGKTSIRAGWGMFYDIFGQGLIRTVDSTALGFSTALRNPAGTQTSLSAPRFTGFYNIPQQLVRPAPPGGFPQTAPEIQAITNSVDNTIKPPYNMNMNFTIGREFGKGFYVQGSYVGRMSRRSLINRDLAMPTNLKDPASGQTYFEAARALAVLGRANTPTRNVGRIPFWENLWPGAAGGGLTATQAIYDSYNFYAPDYTSALYDFDTDICDPSCSRFGPYAIFNSQFSALAALSSIGGGNYHAMQWTVRKRMSAGLQFDFNYTWSKSIDLASGAERSTSPTNTFGGGFVENSWFPGQRKGVSDYDTTQSWSSFWVWEMPVGRGKRFLGNSNRAVDAILGGWQLTGLWSQTTELPVSVGNGRNWPTNWNITGRATQVGMVPTPTKTKNAPAVAGRPGPNVFSNPRTALNAYDFTLPGESGQRNGIRGDGFFTFDIGLGKRFIMPYKESHSVQFRWEVFNLPNTVRFDVNSLTLDLGNTGSFGKYSDVLTNPRVMQFTLRYEF